MQRVRWLREAPADGWDHSILAEYETPPSPASPRRPRRPGRARGG